MFKWLTDWWRGELIEVEVFETRTGDCNWVFYHTVVTLPNGERKYVMGHVGRPGDRIAVNTWDLKKY
jgi:hypothetical protein